MSSADVNIACAVRLGWKFWHNQKETLILAPESTWPALPHWKERGMVEGDGRPDFLIEDPPPDYHGKIELAMQLVEKAREAGWCMEVFATTRPKDPRFVVRFKKIVTQHWHDAYADTLSEAICAAFLKLPL